MPAESKEIKLATVFSGIGAIEHALDRMQLKSKIVFACDNGDVDILSKEIAPNLNEIETELSDLKTQINNIEEINKELEKAGNLTEEDTLYKNELDFIFNRTENEIKLLKNKIKDSINENDIILEKSILKNVINTKQVKDTRRKEYKEFLENLEKVDNLNLPLVFHQIAIDIINDFKKDNSMETLETESTFNSSDGIHWNEISNECLKLSIILEGKEGKKINRQITDICQRTGMLHEKINSLRILKELAQIPDYKAKKEYVDALYKSKEKSNKVKQTYMANYDLDDEHYHWNVSFLDGKQYENQVDLFVGGSPCQSFSLVGKQRGLADTRGTLFYEYARLVKEIKPKVFIYENVRALLSNDDGKTWETIQKVFTDLNYTWDYHVLNAKDYGIPQNRERVFVVGFRNDLLLKEKFKFPEPITLNKTMKDFLIDNVSGRYYLPKKGVDFVTSEKNLSKRFTQIDGDVQLCQKKNQQFNWHGDFVFVEENKDREKTMEDLEKYFLSEKVRKYVLATGTKNFYSRPKTDLEIARPLLTTMHKMHRAGVDNYVTTEGRLRKLTPRECFRLMGFCDSFVIPVSDTAAYQQAGNSIVVDVLIHIMKQILISYPEL